jgi:hypothetical protein
MKKARALAHLYGWVLYGVIEDTLDTKAMYERWLNDETLH